MHPPFVYRLTAPETLIAEPDPESVAFPSQGEVTIETLVSAISPGTELAAWRGDPPLRPVAQVYPRLVGYCNVGQITSVGAGVTDWTVGDLTLSHSAHRTHDRVATTDLLCKIPIGADLIAASTTYLFHLGYNACLKAKLTSGHKVAVIGLGTLGLTSATMANLAGAQVTGFSNQEVTPNDFGIEDVFLKSHTKHDGKFDVVITTSNLWEDWELALRLTRPGGTIAVIGFPGRGQETPANNPLSSQYFYDKQLTIVACGYTPDLAVSEQDVRFTLKRNCAFLLKLALEKRLPTHSLTAEVRDASELPKIYDEMANERRSPKTIILDWKRHLGG